MISLILYGRNDNHGYNLHKRAAISLNAMAEIMRDEGDEIIFVDYNTPDDYPTFIEAIQDTLSPQCMKVLRVLRVRPRQHAHFVGKTHLNAIEPVARNVALRRSNPKNKWILSTNTDMVFTPHNPTESFGDILRRIEKPGIYTLPRFEMPEIMWEQVDRRDGAGIVNAFRDWGKRFHINEIVYGIRTVNYDGPGDFQLCLRDDLFALHGFDERMLIGWHVDSNLGIRFLKKYGCFETLIDHMYGYHCDHTRQATLMHKAGRIENDFGRFVDSIERMDIPEQADTWGLADEEIEEIRLDRLPGKVYIEALEAVMPPPLEKPYEGRYTMASALTPKRDPIHVIPYLADLLTTMTATSRIGLATRDPVFLERIAAVMKRFGFPAPLLMTEREMRAPLTAMLRRLWPEAKDAVWPEELYESSDCLILDAGDIPDGDGRESGLAQGWYEGIEQHFCRFAKRERRAREAKDKAPAKRFVLINAVNNRIEFYAAEYLSAVTTPYSSRIRQGYVTLAAAS